MHSLVSGQKKWKIFPSTIRGTLTLPPSKSQSVRALLFSLMAKGESVIQRPLFSPDFEKLIQIVQNLGAEVTILDESLLVVGTGGRFARVAFPFDIGNSGLAWRFLTALLSLSPNKYQLFGDESVSMRPLSPLLQVLEEGGVSIQKEPLEIQGCFKGGEYTITGSDSQYTSALLMAAPFTSNGLSLKVHELKERPYVEMTLQWLKRLNISYTRKGDQFFVPGRQNLLGFTYAVPGDLSTLAFPLVAALLTESHLQIEGVDLSDCQADGILLSFLRKMGAVIHEEKSSLCVQGPQILNGGSFCIKDCIDLFPILCVLGTYTQTPLCLTGFEAARHKECNRVVAMQSELSKMGAILQEEGNSFMIYPSTLKGARVDSHGDHRIALAMSVAALMASQPSEITNVSCAEKTFRGYCESLQNLGGQTYEFYS